MIINGWDTTVIDSHKAKSSPVRQYPPHQRNHPKILNSNCQYIGVTETQFYPGNPLRYQARIKIAGKSQSLGSFPDQHSAACAREKYIVDNKLIGYRLNNFEKE